MPNISKMVMMLISSFLCGIGEPLHNARFTKQVAQHQHADERSRLGDHQKHNDHRNRGNRIFSVLETGLSCGFM